MLQRSKLVEEAAIKDVLFVMLDNHVAAPHTIRSSEINTEKGMICLTFVSLKQSKL